MVVEPNNPIWQKAHLGLGSVGFAILNHESKDKTEDQCHDLLIMSSVKTVKNHVTTPRVSTNGSLLPSSLAECYPSLRCLRCRNGLGFDPDSNKIQQKRVAETETYISQPLRPLLLSPTVIPNIHHIIYFENLLLVHDTSRHITYVTYTNADSWASMPSFLSSFMLYMYVHAII